MLSCNGLCMYVANALDADGLTALHRAAAAGELPCAGVEIRLTLRAVQERPPAWQLYSTTAPRSKSRPP